MREKRVFVTVGTTKFEKLIETVSRDDILNTLSSLGYKEVLFQTGHGKHEEKKHASLKLSYSTFFEDFQAEIIKSDLVISHAGAGTCLEVLHLHKPLLVVINDDLMDNHQEELAEQLQKDEYLYYCTCDGLKEALEKDFKVLKRYPKPNTHTFNNYINKCMGFV